MKDKEEDKFDFDNYDNSKLLRAAATIFDCSVSEERTSSLSSSSMHSIEDHRNLIQKYGEYPTIAKFNHRGSHVATAYSTGKVVVCDFVSGSVLAALFWPSNEGFDVPITFLQWGKHGRSLLIGSSYSPVIRLFDLTVSKLNEDNASSILSSTVELLLPSKPVSLNMHPSFDYSGVAALDDGRVVIFKFHRDNSLTRVQFLHTKASHQILSDGTKTNDTKRRKLVDMDNSGLPFVANVCFLPERKNGKFKDSTLLVVSDWGDLTILSFPNGIADLNENKIVVNVLYELKRRTSAPKPGTWQLTLSKNGKFFCITSSRDSAIQLYALTSPSFHQRKNEVMIKLEHSFQSNSVNKNFACTSLHFSGQGAEYVVAGYNNNTFYELHLWDTKSGHFVDLLKGPPVELNSVNWHPTRPFIAVTTKNDGLVDIWGPCLNWTAFAPDFHALHENVEYIEKEDEFDIVVRSSNDNEIVSHSDEEGYIDICTVENNAAFQSDTEDETDAFQFPPVAVQVQLPGSQTQRRSAMQLNEI